jgi:RecA-family ATPase
MTDSGKNGEVLSFAGLQLLDLKPPRFIVDGFISEGFTIIAGMPKFGKSFMSLNMALSVASGIDLFSAFPVNRCNTLYLALEDSMNRVCDRAVTICQALNIAMPENAFIKIISSPMCKGGLQELESDICDLGLGLVVIDTLAKFTVGKKHTGNVYDDDYEVSTAIHDVALKYGVAIVATHHTNKRQELDHYLTKVSGSHGVIAGADTILVVHRNEVNLPIISLAGRDVEEHEYTAKFDRETWLWSVEGSAKDIQVNDEQKRIIDLVGHSPTGMLITELKQFFQNKSYESIKRTVQKMADRNMVSIDGGLLRIPYAIL